MQMHTLNPLPLTASMAVMDAMTLAVEAHAGQLRRNGRSYLSHPVLAADELLRAGQSSPFMLGVALLHDSLEENPTRNAEFSAKIERIGGIEMLRAVQYLTEDCPQMPRQWRKERTLQKIRTAPEHIQWVKLADRAANLQDIPSNASVQWVQTYLGETQALLEATQGLRTSFHDRIRWLVQQVGNQSLRQEQDVSAVQCNKAE